VSAGPLVLPGGDGGELRAEPDGGLTVHRDGTAILRSVRPARISLALALGGTGELASDYEDAELRSNRLVARAVLSTSGARFKIEDVFSWTAIGAATGAGAGLRLHRRVTVRLGPSQDPAATPVGFASWFGWTRPGDTALQWLLPGCVYGRNEHAPGYAIGAALGREPVLVREDRLALPFAAAYDPAAGIFVAMVHERPDGTTVAADDLAPVLVSDRLGFGSFGDLSAGELGFLFPGSEGTVSYPPMWTTGIGNAQAGSPVNPFPVTAGPRAGTPAEAAGGPDGGGPWRDAGWARRYHPVADGFTHALTLRTTAGPAESFPAFVRRAWRLGWAQQPPQTRRADLAAVERISLDLLAASVSGPGSGAGDGPLGPIGVPTWIDVFTGQPGRLQNTLSVGFVGRNLEVAYALLRGADRHGQPAWGKLAGELIGSWIATAGGPEGLRHTEWDRVGQAWVDGGQPGTVYLRDQSEAGNALLAAVAWSRAQPGDPERGEWLDWCQAYARWLAAHAGPDGSLGRSYHLDGTPADQSANDGIHAAGFLARLATVTGDHAHANLAERIAAYYWEKFHAAGDFVGGTLDNPNCYDREAATLALDAYLAVHAVTGRPRWLAAAQLAADFCETWIVGWDVPMNAADVTEQPFFDPAAWPAGLGLITLGFSAVDTYLARHVGDFLRLARLTGDVHYADVAELLLHNTKQMVQLGTEYGYRRPGFQIEHWSIGRGRGYGLNSGWLPWVATAHLLGIWAAAEDAAG
jgi:hypothetical protein